MRTIYLGPVRFYRTVGGAYRYDGKKATYTAWGERLTYGQQWTVTADYGDRRESRYASTLRGIRDVIESMERGES